MLFVIQVSKSTHFKLFKGLLETQNDIIDVHYLVANIVFFNLSVAK